MASSGFTIELYTGLSSDELTNYSISQNQIDLYRNALSSINDANAIGSGLWTSFYNYIYQANAVIEGLQNYKGASPLVSQQLIGEAKFTRALWHFIW